MNFFKAATMSVPLVEISAPLWDQIIVHLRKQGAGVRESGAFLLGHITEAGRIVTHYVPYESLQADALHNDYVSLTATSFSRLWDVCRAHNISVVADVHTHRFGPAQSRSDKENPMVALRGHIAFIVPRFAQGTIRREDLGMYVYQGNHKWATYYGADISGAFLINHLGGN